MKTNKFITITSLILMLASVYLSIAMNVKISSNTANDWTSFWLNFGFAVFGSSLLAFLTSITTYFQTKKEIAKNIGNLVLNWSSDSNTQFYHVENQISFNMLAHTLNVCEIFSNNLFFLLTQYYEGLTLFSKDKKKVYEVIQYLTNKYMNEIKIIGTNLKNDKQFIKTKKSDVISDVKKLIHDETFIDFAKYIIGKNCSNMGIQSDEENVELQKGVNRYHKK